MLDSDLDDMTRSWLTDRRILASYKFQLVMSFPAMSRRPSDLDSMPAERVGQWTGFNPGTTLHSRCGLSLKCVQDGGNGSCVKLEASKPT